MEKQYSRIGYCCFCVDCVTEKNETEYAESRKYGEAKGVSNIDHSYRMDLIQGSSKGCLKAVLLSL